MSPMILQKPNILIIGLGLMGSSLAAALKQNHYPCRLIGYSRNAQTATRAVALNIIDESLESLDASVANMDIVVLCTPLGAYAPVLEQLKPHLSAHSIVTDVGSVKGCVRQAAVEVFGAMPEKFVLGHPIAGSEKNGLDAVNPCLYERHRVILTPCANTDENALNTIQNLWQSVGAEVTVMSVESHDKILAATSHLPHLVAFSMLDTLAGKPDNHEILSCAAGGFRDFTRIAASDAQVWHDIFVANCPALIEVARQFQAGLEQLLQSIEQQDQAAIMGVLTRAKAARDHFSQVLKNRDEKN